MKSTSIHDNRKNVLVDSSSIIILYKSGLLEKVILYYNIYMTDSVFNELTQSNHAGSAEVKQFKIEKTIQVVSSGLMTIPVEDEQKKLASLDKGEYDTIVAYLNSAGDFIILDDGKGAVYCKKNDIPYINALLVPRILLLSSIITKEDYDVMTHKVVEFGRYSEKIIEFARLCTNGRLEYFL
ncbi:MAG: hypothetical protein KBC90_01600 [Spirochaetes bacterium]|nr:hypothetical protein [Spirochaetota bacterium]